jgi:hypothetical protein
VGAVNFSVTEHMEETSSLISLATLLEAGALSTRVAMRLPAEEARQAHQLLQHGGAHRCLLLLMTTLARSEWDLRLRPPMGRYKLNSVVVASNLCTPLGATSHRAARSARTLPSSQA